MVNSKGVWSKQMNFSLPCSAIVEMGMRHLVSSANSKTNEEDIKSGRSLINIKNNSGPSILP